MWLSELEALLLMWVGFMTVVGVYVIRIALMLRAQRAMERSLRLRIALRSGRAVREAARANLT
jgi:hypothetical protein